MNEPSSHDAPALGAPTDAVIDEETAAALLNTGDARAGREAGGAGRGERTFATPDDLGGTGGSQEGGAG